MKILCGISLLTLVFGKRTRLLILQVYRMKPIPTCTDFMNYLEKVEETIDEERKGYLQK